MYLRKKVTTIIIMVNFLRNEEKIVCRILNKCIARIILGENKRGKTQGKAKNEKRSVKLNTVCWRKVLGKEMGSESLECHHH